MTYRQAKHLRSVIESMSESLTDEVALTVPEFFPIWQPDVTYEAEKRIQHDGILYRVVQGHTSQEHQPPGSEGMLAIYRPVVAEPSGTIDDPIPFIYGMDCSNGLYYSYNGNLYLCKADMAPCVWPPDSGIWQWELVEP